MGKLKSTKSVKPESAEAESKNEKGEYLYEGNYFYDEKFNLFFLNRKQEYSKDGMITKFFLSEFNPESAYNPTLKELPREISRAELVEKFKPCAHTLFIEGKYWPIIGVDIVDPVISILPETGAASIPISINYGGGNSVLVSDLSDETVQEFLTYHEDDFTLPMQCATFKGNQNQGRLDFARAVIGSFLLHVRWINLM
jgi:hypothetical protein